MEPIEKTTFQLSKFVKRQISRLRVRCINRPSGCTWEGHLEDDHSQTVIRKPYSKAKSVTNSLAFLLAIVLLPKR